MAVALAHATVSRDPAVRALVLRRAKLELNVEFFAPLRRRTSPHFAALVTFLVDFASHRYWRYRSDELSSSDRTLRGAVDDAYVRCDRVLGRLLGELPGDTVVAVVSEHGMAPEPESAEIGEWRYVIRAERLRELAGLDGELVACPIARWVSYRAVGGGRIAAANAGRLRSVTLVPNGKPLFEVFEHGADEIVVKLALDRSTPRDASGGLEAVAVHCGGTEVPFAALAKRLGPTRSAMHARDGLLVLAGPGIARGRELEAGLVDFAPTILHAAGIPIPPEMNGRVLDVFESPRAARD